METKSFVSFGKIILAPPCIGKTTFVQSQEGIKKEWVDTDGTATWSVDNCKYKPDPTGPSQYGPKYQEVDSGILKDMWDENHGPCRGKPTAVVRPEYSNWETATLSARQTYPATGKNTRILWTPPEIN